MLAIVEVWPRGVGIRTSSEPVPRRRASQVAPLALRASLLLRVNPSSALLKSSLSFGIETSFPVEIDEVTGRRIVTTRRGLLKSSLSFGIETSFPVEIEQVADRRIVTTCRGLLKSSLSFGIETPVPIEIEQVADRRIVNRKHGRRIVTARHGRCASGSLLLQLQ